jgi:hypothetical protein
VAKHGFKAMIAGGRSLTYNPDFAAPTFLSRYFSPESIHEASRCLLHRRREGQFAQIRCRLTRWLPNFELLAIMAVGRKLITVTPGLQDLLFFSVSVNKGPSRSEAAQHSRGDENEG